MVEQEDIIALTKHVRSFSDALNNLRNNFKDSVVDGTYNHEECQAQTHTRLSNVLKILQGILAKYPPLHSQDILGATANIINKIRNHNYAEGKDGPPDFYGAIDHLALSFSASVSDFLMGDTDIRGSPNTQLDQDEENDGDAEEYDADMYSDSNFLTPEEEDEKNNESEDSLERLSTTAPGGDNLIGSGTPGTPESGTPESGTPESDSLLAPTLLQSDINTDPSLSPREGANALSSRRHGKAHLYSSFNANEPTAEFPYKDELDKTLLSIEESVEIALKRTKIWSKYAKDLLMYIERRSNYELEYCRQIDKLAKQTRTSVSEESHLPLQNIFVTALEHDIEFNSNYHKSYHSSFVPIVEKLMHKQKEHDIKRSKIKTRWKAGLKKQHDSVESLKNMKKLYIQKEKELEKFNKQQLEGKEKEKEKGFMIGKRKVQEDFEKSVLDSEDHYKRCVDDANNIQAELDRTKAEVLIQFRQLIFECDLVMKSACVAYYEMMNILISPLPIQYRQLHDESKLYKEGQQFCDFIQLQKATCSNAHSPRYDFEPYKGDGKYSSVYRHGGGDETVSPSSLKPRTTSNNSEYDYPKSPNTSSNKKMLKPSMSTGGSGNWGSLGRTKGSATDDTDSLSSHSLNGSPSSSPPKTRRSFKLHNNTSIDAHSDDEHGNLKTTGLGARAASGSKNRKLSAAAEGHKFRRLHAPSKCKECESYVYFNGQECEQCGIICHKKCLETLAIKCGNKRLPRKMTTFGVDFITHLATTQRPNIPYIIETCVNAIDEVGVGVKGIYRVSGVKSKVEKLCQCFEAGGNLVDLSNTPPHFISSVLKLYLRQLPEPLMTFKLYQPLIAVAKDSMNLKLDPVGINELSEEDSQQYQEIIQTVHEIVKELPEPNFFTAAKIIRHLRRVADNQDENQMGASNLAIVFGPTLLRPEGSSNSLAAVMDMPIQSRAVELLILNSHIFSTTKDGEIDIETLTGEKRRAPSRRRQPKRGRIDTVPEASDELPEDNDANVASEFTSEMLTSFSMEDNIIPLSELMNTTVESTLVSVDKKVPHDNNSQFSSNSAVLHHVTPIVQTVPVVRSTPVEDSTPVLQTTTIQPTRVLLQPEIAQSTPTLKTTTNDSFDVETPILNDTIDSASNSRLPPFPVVDNSGVGGGGDVVVSRAGTAAVVSRKASRPVAQAFSESGNYDNLPGLESDILNDDHGDDTKLPKHKPLAVALSTGSTSSTTDTDSVYSRFTSIESLLMGEGLSFRTTTNTMELPIAAVDQEDSDDAWMDKFGKDTHSSILAKEPLTKTKSSSVLERNKTAPITVSDLNKSVDSSPNITVDPFSYPVRKKKNASLSRIETTSYSFSLGNNTKDENNDIVSSPSSANKECDSPAAGFVKRDGKERVPVRKHLKSVNIKAAVNVASPTLQGSESSSGGLVSPASGLKDTPFTLVDSKLKHDSSKGDLHGSSLSVDSENNDSEGDSLELNADGSLSPSKRAPAVLPKPKKHLDKKSWTADLIKSKTHTMADHPQPGSLNDKLLNINRRKTEEKPSDDTGSDSSNNNSGSPSSLGNVSAGGGGGLSRTSKTNRSIKEIRTNFASTPSPRSPTDKDLLTSAESTAGNSEYNEMGV